MTLPKPLNPSNPFFARALAAAVLAAACSAAHAQQATPAGLWKTIDDETKTEKSLVRIAPDADGALSGRIERLLDPAKAGAICDKCSGERHGKPIAGMTVLSGARKAEGGEFVWEGGQILDPNNGKTYKVRLKPIDDGTRLEVRGYIGPFYRNQVWQRVE
jgi:uncharacterized protein (DUF2147 family)